MSNEKHNTDNELANRLREIFPEPIAERVVDVVVSKRPAGWGRKSIAPYYKENYARGIQIDIDRMIESRGQLVYRYDIWCKDIPGSKVPIMSTNTLYNRINQSIKFLIDYLDTPDKKYRDWYNTVRIERRVGLGIVIFFIVGLDIEGAFHAELAEAVEAMPVWERQMEEWLEGNDNRPFMKDGLALTADEMTKHKQRFSRLTNVMASITSSTIKIIKLK